MAEDSDLERTEPASGKKLQEARDRGNIPRSRELSTFAVLIVSGAVVAMTGSYLYEGLSGMMKRTLTFGYTDVEDVSMMGRSLNEASNDAVWILLPFGAAVLFAAIVSNLMISGWNFTFDAIQPKLSKLNPLSGIKRMFSTNSLVELFKALMKGMLIAGASGWMIWMQMDAILALSTEPFESAMPHFGDIVLWTFIAAAAAFALIAFIDVPYQIWNYHKSLRMTKEEVKQEAKQSEGDPKIKQRIRSMQFEQARRRMMSNVPKADVVVTNPLHFAVALQYDEKKMAAPVVLAKGSELVAARIRELAREHHVPIVEAPPLARALHRHVEIGEAIPQSLFTAVAQVLAYVYQLNNQMNPEQPDTWQVPAELDPQAGATP